MPDPITGIAGAASAIGGLSSSSAAKSAARAQTNAANQQTALQRDIYNQQTELFSPFYESGKTAQNALNYEMGLGEAPEGYAGYQSTPGYEFRLNEGTNALEGSAAARGGLFSGATAKALTQYGQDYATNDYQNYLSNLKSLSNTGLSAAAQTSNAAQNYGTATGNATAAAANATSAGYIGSANALNQAIDNGIGILQYQNALNAGT